MRMSACISYADQLNKFAIVVKGKTTSDCFQSKTECYLDESHYCF